MRPVKLSSIHVGPFAALDNLRVDFVPGLNVVLGPNEAGKSTLYSALALLLFVPTKLSVPQFKKQVARFLPRPAGDFVEADLAFSAGERAYRLAKRWGADAYSVLETPEGSIRDQGAVAAAAADLLPVSEGSFRAVFLNAQRSIADPLDELDGTSLRRDLGEVLRRAAFETGGVSIEEFRSGLKHRLEETYRRWDEAAEAPERRRPGEGRWVKGAGILTKASYALEDAEKRRRAVQEADARIAEASVRLEEHTAQRDAAAVFVAAHRELHGRVLRGRAIAAEAALLEEKIRERAEAAKSWPVQDHRIKEGSEELASTQARLEKTKQDVAMLDTAIEAASRLRERETHNRTVADLEAELESNPAIDRKTVDRLAKIEDKLSRIAVELSTGTLHARVVADRDVRVAWSADDDNPATSVLSTGDEVLVDGRRFLRFELDDARIEVTTGDIDVHELRAARDRLNAERDAIKEAVGTGSSEEAQKLHLARADVETRLGRARGLLADVLVEEGDESAIVEALELVSSARQDVADPVSELKRGQKEIAARQIDLTNKAAALTARVDGARAHVAELASRYGNVDSLVEELGDLRHRKRTLEAETVSGLSLPDGFDTPDEFTHAYHQAEVTERQEAMTCAELRSELATAEAARPEESLDDLREEVARSEYELERLKRRGKALRRVAEATDRLLSQMDADTFLPFVERFSHFATRIVGGAYKPARSKEVLGSSFHRRDGVELPYELLSTGTRGSLGLAVRLALAASLLGEGGEAFVVLDDPLVELDPGRRKAAAELIRSFAQSVQTVYFTCHPDHAAVFNGAEVTQLEPAAW